MNITVFTACAIKNKRAACAAILTAEQDGRGQQRQIAYALGPVTNNAAALQALRLGLMAVRPRAADAFEIFTEQPYASDMLLRAGEGWRVTPKSNVELVEAIRKYCLDNYGGPVMLTVICTALPKSDRAMAECVKLAQRVALEQKHFDSGTFETTTGGHDGREVLRGDVKEPG